MSVVRELLPRISRPKITYGFSTDADFRITNLSQEQQITQFEVMRKEAKDKLKITLNMPGRHNALNATAAIAIATDEGIAARISRAVSKISLELVAVSMCRVNLP